MILLDAPFESVDNFVNHHLGLIRRKKWARSFFREVTTHGFPLVIKWGTKPLDLQIYQDESKRAAEINKINDTLLQESDELSYYR